MPEQPTDDGLVAISRFRLAELEIIEQAAVEWCQCRLTGADGLQLACDHDQHIVSAARLAYRRKHPME